VSCSRKTGLTAVLEPAGSWTILVRGAGPSHRKRPKTVPFVHKGRLGLIAVAAPRGMSGQDQAAKKRTRGASASELDHGAVGADLQARTP